jgi:hypothetical protein
MTKRNAPKIDRKSYLLGYKAGQRAMWRATGRCTTCGGDPQDGKHTCEACLATRLARRARTRGKART